METATKQSVTAPYSVATVIFDQIIASVGMSVVTSWGRKISPCYMAQWKPRVNV